MSEPPPKPEKGCDAVELLVAAGAIGLVLAGFFAELFGRTGAVGAIVLAAGGLLRLSFVVRSVDGVVLVLGCGMLAELVGCLGKASLACCAKLLFVCWLKVFTRLEN